MMETLPIETGVPMPPQNVRRYPWDTMNVSDSFVFPDNLLPENAYKRVSQANDRYAPKRFTARKMNGEVRCWRVA